MLPYNSLGFTPYEQQYLYKAYWPTSLLVATKNGIYKTDTFTGHDVAVQPVWYTDNDGLPDLSLSNIELAALSHSPNAPEQQAALVKDTTPIPATYTIYARNDGGTWTNVLTEAQAQSQVGVASPVKIWFMEYSSNGRLYAIVGVFNFSDPNVYLFYSTDDGNTWNHYIILLPSGLLVAVRLLAVNGNEIVFYADRNFGGWYFRSTDGGETWETTYDISGGYATGLQYLYLFDTAIGTTNVDDIYYFSRTELNRGLLIDTNLAINNPNGIVQDNKNSQKQYAVRLAVGVNQFSYTDDGWTTHITRNGFSPFLARVFTPLTGRDAFDFIFFGRNFLPDYAPAAIEIMYTPTGTPIAKAGDNPDIPPYTNSIPETCGGVINGGIIAL